jgi:hypothetical protein
MEALMSNHIPANSGWHVRGTDAMRQAELAKPIAPDATHPRWASEPTRIRVTRAFRYKGQTLEVGKVYTIERQVALGLLKIKLTILD